MTVFGSRVRALSLRDLRRISRVRVRVLHRWAGSRYGPKSRRPLQPPGPPGPRRPRPSGTKQRTCEDVSVRLIVCASLCSLVCARVGVRVCAFAGRLAVSVVACCRLSSPVARCLSFAAYLARGASLLFFFSLSSADSSRVLLLARRPRYTHKDGSREAVRVVKAHSEAEGGGFTIHVPSIGRERMTVAQRLTFPEGSAHVPAAQQAPPAEPVAPAAQEGGV